MALPINTITKNIPANFRPNTVGNTTETNGNIRTLKAKALDGGAKSSKGLVDNRLFTDAVTLNAVMDMETSLWSLKQSSGSVDPKFRDKRWTSFRMLFNDVVTYYKLRNVEVTETHAEYTPTIYRE